MKHVTRYIQPGLELIALDPKRSATIIGPEAFESEETLREVALRAACDIGVANQEGCACARVIYVLCGTDAAGLAKANRLGEAIYEALLAPARAHQHRRRRASTASCATTSNASRLADDWFRVIGGERDEGAIIVSQIDEPVDYSPLLSGRVANVVPVDDIAQGDRRRERLHPDGRASTRRSSSPSCATCCRCSARSASPRSATPATWRSRCRRTRSSRCAGCASGSSTRRAIPETVFPMWKAARAERR